VISLQAGVVSIYSCHTNANYGNGKQWRGRVGLSALVSKNGSDYQKLRLLVCYCYCVVPGSGDTVTNSVVHRDLFGHSFYFFTNTGPTVYQCTGSSKSTDTDVGVPLSGIFLHDMSAFASFFFVWFIEISVALTFWSPRASRGLFHNAIEPSVHLRPDNVDVVGVGLRSL